MPQILPLVTLLALLPSACSRVAPPRASPAQPVAAAVAPLDADALFRFVAYGDTRTQHQVHRRIVAGVLSVQPGFVLQTGDLVANGDSRKQWQTFDDITGELRRKIPYYPARGNHDQSDRGYYEARVNQPGISGTKLYYSFEKVPLHFVSIDTEQPLAAGSAERTWLEADLAGAQAAGRFIVPFFHKAIFSIGQHAADSDVRALQPVLHPLFRKYGVRLVFQGHDHVYYRTLRDGITYLVTGGGGAPLYDDRHPEFGAPGDVFRKTHHFCIVDTYADHLQVVARDENLKEIDRFRVEVPGG